MRYALAAFLALLAWWLWNDPRAIWGLWAVCAIAAVVVLLPKRWRDAALDWICGR